MACPICDHTMHVIMGVHWCPRCGALRDALKQTHTPKLVERCRQFDSLVLRSRGVPGEEYRLGEWNRLGIAESISPPEKRT